MNLMVDIKKQVKGFMLQVCFEMTQDRLVIMGSSGSGKSLTLKCIAGIETPDEGRIVLDGRVLFDSREHINLSPQDRHVGILFQEYMLFPHMTVEENIGLGLKCSPSEHLEKVQTIMKTFRLNGLETKYPSQISGGEAQRVALARSMVYEPQLLMLDEPFSALDSYLREALQVELLDLIHHYTGKVLMVTHDKREAYRFSDRLLVLARGSSVIMGHLKSIIEQPQYVEVAMLTGCSNLSSIQFLSPHRLQAEDWGIEITCMKEVATCYKSIGVYPYALKILDDSSQPNTFSLEVVRVIEENHRLCVHCVSKRDGSRPLIVYAHKALLQAVKKEQRILVQIPEEAILFLE